MCSLSLTGFKIQIVLVLTSLIFITFNITSSLARPLVSGSGFARNTLSIESQHEQHQSIILYTNVNFRGISLEMSLNHSSCVNLRGILNDLHSSVDAKGGCVILCEQERCRGRCQAIRYYSSDLSRLGLNDKVSSAKTCNSSYS